MAADYKTTFRRYGRFYQSSRKYMQRKEVLVSTNVILTLFTISFFAAFAIRPTALTISRLWREIKDKQQVRQQLEEKIANLEEAQSVLSQVEEDLFLLDAAIPSSFEFSRFVRIIEYLIATHRLQLNSNLYQNIELYVSEKEASATAVAAQTHPLSIKMKGAFTDIRSFVTDLERLDRIISINSITITPSRKQQREGLFDLEVGIEAQTYSFPKGEHLISG